MLGSTIAGVAVGAIFLLLMELSARFISDDSSWKSPITIFLVAFSPIFPGFVGGYFSRTRGFLAGAIVAALASVLMHSYIALIDSRSIVERLGESPVEEVPFVLAAIIVGGVCGIAGAAVARERWNAF